MFKLFMVLAMIVGSGCASTKVYQATMTLKPGLKKQQVLDVLGKPATWEIYEQLDGTRVEYLFYTHFNSYEESTPICFISNKLAGWGNTYYQDHVNDKDKRLR